MSKVSAILCSLSHGKYMREATDNVLAQTYADYELIIWNDASMDDLWGIIANYSGLKAGKPRNVNARRCLVNEIHIMKLGQ